MRLSIRHPTTLSACTIKPVRWSSLDLEDRWHPERTKPWQIAKHWCRQRYIVETLTSQNPATLTSQTMGRLMLSPAWQHLPSYASDQTFVNRSGSVMRSWIESPSQPHSEVLSDLSFRKWDATCNEVLAGAWDTGCDNLKCCRFGN